LNRAEATCLSSGPRHEGVPESGLRIAAIQCRFYDLAGGKATPISRAGKKHSAAEALRETPGKRHEKAWLTFSGYQSLIELAALLRRTNTGRMMPNRERLAPRWG
jgi:hypothetical protein